MLVDSDAFGQPLTIAGGGCTLSYDYDVTIPARENSMGPYEPGGVKQEQVSLGVGASSASATLAYTYDADAVVQTATVTSPASAASATTSLRFTRGAPTAPVCGTPLDPSCGWTPLTMTATSPTFATTTTAISVSPFGELRSMSTTASYVSGPLYEAEICARDSQGRITDRRELLPASGTLPRQVFHHFDYDAAGRLRRDRGYSGRAMAETCTSWLAAFTSNPMLAADRGADTTMGYDDNGNLTAGPQTSCSDYDAADRPICRPRRSYNRRGQLTSPGHGDTVAYDVLGRLRSFRHGSTRISYDWDPAGRLAHIGGSSTGEEYFVYDGSRVRAWRRGADTSFFVYGTMGHVPDLMYRDVGSHGTTIETYRLITDERGSVRLVVRIDGATPGTVAQRIDYDVWGAPTFVSGDARTQPFGFAGGLWLRDASLWRFGARDYDPSIGAWTAHDPIGFEGGPNQYAYCSGDPVNFVDWSGLQIYPTDPLLRAVVSGDPAPAEDLTGVSDILAALFGVSATPPLGQALAEQVGRETGAYGVDSAHGSGLWAQQLLQRVRETNGWMDVVPVGSKAEEFRNAEHYWVAYNHVHQDRFPEFLVAPGIFVWAWGKSIFEPNDRATTDEIACGLRGTFGL